MSKAIIITPVKDSLATTKLTIQAITSAEGDFEYFVFNDFSNTETKSFLDDTKGTLGYNVIHLEDVTDTPSPNYKLVLKMAQKMALEKNGPLVIIESDVVINPDTITNLLQIANCKEKTGMVGAITVDTEGNYNFPYTFEKIKNTDILNTEHSLSFCCTLLTVDFLKEFDFKTLSDTKDWYDVFISRQSKKIGFNNYLAKGIEVQHLPHSSRPWKNLKYKKPILYYLKKIFLKRDRI